MDYYVLALALASEAMWLNNSAFSPRCLSVLECIGSLGDSHNGRGQYLGDVEYMESDTLRLRQESGGLEMPHGYHAGESPG
ncbi:hypothetical protein BDV32DRAFT_121971 [Aspergillus pseudonomiae]|nr:hypothetical protein BDV32DRAFT_121971 [Aspergillus pseudonomiae]